MRFGGDCRGNQGRGTDQPEDGAEPAGVSLKGQPSKLVDIEGRVLSRRGLGYEDSVGPGMAFIVQHGRMENPASACYRPQEPSGCNRILPPGENQ